MAHEQPPPTQQLSTTPAPSHAEPPVFELVPEPLIPEPPVPEPPVPEPYIYEARYSPEYTDSEKSALLAFVPLPVAPAPSLPEPPIFDLVPLSPVSEPYVYEPRYSPEYTDSEQSALSAFVSVPDAHGPCIPPEQLVTQDTIAQLYACVRQFYPNYTDSEISALAAFWDHPYAPRPCPPPQQPISQEVESQLDAPTIYTNPGYTDSDAFALAALGVHPNAPEPCAPFQQPHPHEAEFQLYIPDFPEYTDSERSALGAFGAHSSAPDPCPSPQQPIPHEAFTHEAVTPSFARKRSNNVRHGHKMLKDKRLRDGYPTNKRLSIRRLVLPYPKSESIRRERVHSRLLRGPKPTNRDAGLRHCRLRFMNRHRCIRWLKGERVTRSLDGTQAMVPCTTTPVLIMPTDGLGSEVIPRPISVPEATNPTPAVLPVDFPVSQPVPATADVQAPNEQPAYQPTDHPPQGMAPIPSINDASVSSGLLTTSATTPAPVVSSTAADDDDDDDNNLIKSHRKVRRNIALFKEGPMKWMPDKVVYDLKDALKDLKAANRRSKRRLLSRKRPISLTGSMKCTKNFEGLMPGDRMARPQRKRDWINAYMQLVLDKRCRRVPADATLPPRRVQKSNGEAAGENEKKDPAAADGDDTEDKTAEGLVDDFDILPPGWAMGDDEVGGGVDDYTSYQHYTPSGPVATDESQPSEAEADSQAADQLADVTSTAGARASALESMMSKMKIQHGGSSSHKGQNSLAPVARVAMN